MSEIINKEICLMPFQNAFFRFRARFPGFVSAWGTGKTMTAILKGILLSQIYKNNLGLIVRKKFTDLRDSTLKDFERYTGLHVPLSTKEITIPGTNSVVMFRHGEELSGLQNVNLGWVYIEQAEEFETSDQFDMLRGRLRRELEPDDSFKGEGYYRDFVEEMKARPLRQMMVGANAFGHNWVWRRWVERGKGFEDYEVIQARTFDNRQNLPEDFINDLLRLKHDNIKKYNRYVLNSHEDYDLEGAYYAALMSDALKDGRVGERNLWEPLAPVYTFWDLGTRASDTTAIWFVQFIRDEIRLIDYYEAYGQGMNHYNGHLNKQDYNYVEHWLPPDAKQTLQGNELDTRYSIMCRHRHPKHEQVYLVDRHRIESRIEMVRGILPKCRFDEKCALGVEALNHYKTLPRQQLSHEDRLSLQPKPLHDWASNGADAFGYGAFVYRNQLLVNDRLIGYPEPLGGRDYDEDDEGEWNRLEYHRRRYCGSMYDRMRA